MIWDVPKVYYFIPIFWAIVIVKFTWQGQLIIILSIQKHAMNKVSRSCSNEFYHWCTSPWPMLLKSTPYAGADIESGRLYIISLALLPGLLLRRPPESPIAVRRHQTTSIIYDRDGDAACGLFLCLSCALMHSLCNKWIVNAFPPAVFPSVSSSLFPLVFPVLLRPINQLGSYEIRIWH